MSSSAATVPEDGKIPICPQRLMDLRVYFGFESQGELARRIGVSRRALQNYLKGGRNLAQRIPQGN
ncbi:MAG UNVERIFIED_CONTAM: helix-turn-helix domain-containing protein [Planctomycetaceae bacterium]